MQREEIVALSKYRLERAKEELNTSKLLFQNAIYLKSLNCSYYSIFHATRALLVYDEFDSKKHSGIISYFIKNYIKTKKLDEELGQIVLDAMRDRNDSDYRDYYTVSEDDAEYQINKAAKFIDSIEKFISENQN